MENKQKITVIFLSLAAITYGINVTSVYPRGKVTITEGDNVELQCVTNENFYYCDFYNDNVTFQYSLSHTAYNESNYYEAINLDSGIDKKRTTWIGDLENYNTIGCKIQIQSATLLDNGLWSCNLEKWNDAIPQDKETEEITSKYDFVNFEIISDFKLVGNMPTDYNGDGYITVNEGVE